MDLIASMLHLGFDRYQPEFLEIDANLELPQEARRHGTMISKSMREGKYLSMRGSVINSVFFDHNGHFAGVSIRDVEMGYLAYIAPFFRT